MPITLRAFTSADSLSPEHSQQIQALYDASPEFGDGKDALVQLKTALGRGDVFYAAEFNDKLIAGVWSRGVGDTRILQYIVTHPANRGRGIALRLIEQVCVLESDKGVSHFEPGCGAVRRILAQLHPA